MANPVRCCTFCFEDNHRLNQCNSILLIDLAKRIYRSYQIINRDILENEDPEIRFYNTLRRYFNSIELRAVCVRFLNGRSRWTKQQYINHIINNIHILQIFAEPIPEPRQTQIQQQVQQQVQIQNEMYEFIENYLNSNPYQNQDITIISSTTQVYNYTLIPRNLQNDFNSELDDYNSELNNYTTIELDIIYNTDNNSIINNNYITCPICLEDNIQASNKIQLNCKHEYCFDCISKVITSCINQPKCSLCRTNITKICVEEGCKNLLDDLQSLVNV